MSDESDEALFDRMMTALRNRSINEDDPDAWNRLIEVDHTPRGWGLQVSVSWEYGDYWDNEESVYGQPTINAAIRALAAKVLAGATERDRG
jgi:hypothetical protein